ncbi:hypothetical protein CPC08DRAFT_706524 [Agrocybe pediades]|nr:hypothetical protein CPC08DRAFT_706524 [Agrocybe pediades]
MKANPEYPMICDLCYVSSSSMDELKRHMSQHKPTVDSQGMKHCPLGTRNPESGTWCPFESLEESAIIDHLASRHSRNVFDCPTCDWSSHCMANLIRHRKRVHQYELPAKKTKPRVTLVLPPEFQ